MATNNTAYRKSISSTQFWKIFFWFTILYLLFISFKSTIDETIVEKVLKQFPATVLTDILFLVITGYLIYKTWESYQSGLQPAIYSLVLAGFIILSYLLIHLSGSYEFYQIQILGLTWVRYTDLTCLMLCLHVLHFRSFQNTLKKSTANSLIPDEADPENIPDLIHGDGFITKIAATINDTSSRKSITIGVFASWGSGKTDFLKRLQKQLEANIDNKVLEFNPWKASTTKSLHEDFFAVLSSALKTFDRSIVPKIKSYSKKIFSAGKEVQYRVLDAVMGEIVSDQSLEKEYESINELIQLTGKRFIVFIDDLDRMSGQEVLEVLRLIRNSASFDNTFFVVALDHDYIVSVLSKTDLLSKEDQYLKKIFQLSITLPKIRKENFKAEIERLLYTDDLTDQHKEKINRVLSLLHYGPMPMAARVSVKNEYHLEQMLDNFRDVKRFCNSFKISFGLLKEEVDPLDLFMLELIKTKSFSVYENIASKELLRFEPNQTPYQYNLDSVAWQNLADSLKLDAKTKTNLEDALNYLLDTHSLKGPRAFAHPYNYYLYFCYQLFNLISLKDFNEAIELNWKGMRAKINQWVQEGKVNDLNRILNNIRDFKDRDQLEKFAKVYLFNEPRAAGKGNFFSNAKAILLEPNGSTQQFFKTNPDYKNFILSILDDSELPLYDRAAIAHEFLKQIITGQKKSPFTRHELQEIIYNLFDQYLNQKDHYDDEVYSFYLLADDSTDRTVRVVPYKKASERLHEFLKNPERFEEFLNILIRSYSQPNQKNEFVIEPFTDDIFGGLTNFQYALIAHNPRSNTTEAIKNIVLEHFEAISKSSGRFKVTDSMKRFIISHLRETKQYNFSDREDDTMKSTYRQE